MIGSLQRWWHTRVKNHGMVSRKVSVPMWDPSAKGWLHRCSCGEVWAE
jgi:hypothetical protein